MPGKSYTWSLSWNGTRIPQDGLRNGLVRIISGSKSLGLASSSMPSAFYVAWGFIINFDKFFLCFLLRQHRVPVSAKGCQL